MNRDKIIQHVVNFLMVEFPDRIQMYKRSDFKSNIWNISELRLSLFNHTWLEEKEPVIEIRYNDVINSVIIDGLSEPEFQMVKLIVNYKIKIVNTGKEA